MVLVVGSVYTFAGTIGGAVTFTIAARVSKIRPSQSVDGVGMIEVSAESNGSFNPNSL